ncbi:MAG: hypothetical protein KDK39_07445, partial [Leptospiraceae bacterium]|nr:hypothetical protein [Leptospiraceae bacterium]
LANIRQALMDYPGGIKRSVIDVVVNEKISQPDQRLLMNMVIDQAEVDQVADFIEARLGYRPDTTPSDVTSEGVQIIYADDLSPQALAARRKRNKLIMLGALGLALLTAASLGTWSLFQYFSIRNRYESGLAELHQARFSMSASKRDAHKLRAERFFEQARAADGGQFNTEFLNRYGIAYMKAGFYEEAFIKLYGKVEPPYGTRDRNLAWNSAGRRAPILTRDPQTPWPRPEAWKEGQRINYLEKGQSPRTVIIPGAYLVDRLRDEVYNKTTILNLSRFHSNHAHSFKDSTWHNNDLAIDYDRLILTVMNQPDDLDAITMIGTIYYHEQSWGKAARFYNQAIEKHPMDVRGHAGMINTYIEIWKRNQDPRMVLAKHREIRAMGLEEDLPLYLTAKLASFYIDLDPDDLRIRYQVDPVDVLSELDLRDNAAHLLELVFNREEDRDGITIVGSRYGEGYYQRGRFLMTQNEPLRAVRQFQNAHNYDPLHFLAINAIGEYYMNRRDFDKAAEYFIKAIQTAREFYPLQGNRPEDETLQNGEIGRIYFNLGALNYLRFAGFEADRKLGIPGPRMYPANKKTIETAAIQDRRQKLAQAREYLLEAQKEGIRDERIQTHALYWLGWIDYMNADFESALQIWSQIEPEYSDADPVLIQGRANAGFYTGQIRSALGYYLKLAADYDVQVNAIQNPDPENEEHQHLFLTLSAIQNNIGAVNEMEYLEMKTRGASKRDLQNLESESLQHYYRAIDLARQMNRDNEIARTNLQLSFKEGIRRDRDPLLDDWLSPTLARLAMDY